MRTAASGEKNTGVVSRAREDEICTRTHRIADLPEVLLLLLFLRSASGAQRPLKLALEANFLLPQQL